MAETLLTTFVVVGGIAGVILGLYGVAPLIFRGRVSGLVGNLGARREDRIVASELATLATDQQRARAYGLLVDSRRQGHGLFGFSPLRFARGQDLPDDDDEEEEDKDDLTLEVWTPPPVAAKPPLPLEKRPESIDVTAASPAPEEPPFQPSAAISTDEPEEEPGLDEELIDIFREVKPVNTSNQERARETVAKELPEIGISELLTDAIWTARGLRFVSSGSRKPPR